MNVRFRVDLNQKERDQLGAMLSGGKHAARRLKRAQILLAADAGEPDVAIAANVCVGRKKLVSEIDAWQKQRNSANARTKWMFTTDRTRIASINTHACSASSG